MIYDKEPLIDICVPVFGVEKYIERCATTLFEQTYGNIEYIFVNDQTPDKSWDILLDVLERYPHRKSQTKLLCHDVNRGIAAARKTALAHTNGQFVLWVDSDDYVDIHLIDQVIQKQKEEDFDIVTFDYNVIYIDHIEYVKQAHFDCKKDRTISLLERRSPVSLWSGLHKLSLYKDYDISFEEGIDYGEDYGVTTILSYYANKIGYIDRNLYNYVKTNDHSYTNSFSQKQSEQGWHEISKLAKFFQDKGQEYIDAINYSKLDFLRSSIKMCIKERQNDYCQVLLKRLKGIDKRYWRKLPLKKRLYLSFVYYYNILTHM